MREKNALTDSFAEIHKVTANLTEYDLLSAMRNILLGSAVAPELIISLETFGYLKSGRVCVPVFEKKHSNTIQRIESILEDVLLQPISEWLSNLNSLKIIAMSHGVPQKEIANELELSQSEICKRLYKLIEKVKDNVSIPVIGNGDIKTQEDAKRMLDETKCDAVMIGRGVLGNPWLIQNTIRYLNGESIQDISVEERIDMCLKHLDYLYQLKSEKLACLEIRNHIAWYLKGLSGSNEIKKQIYACHNFKEIESILDNYNKEA